MSLGLVGVKTGMTRVFDETGTSIPVTVINIDSNRISQIKTKERDGYSAIQVAYGSQKESNIIISYRIIDSFHFHLVINP